MATVNVRSMDGLQQEITAGKNVILADEPVEAGGGGTGLNPYELLLAALGACKSMTVSMYARRKGWDLQRVDVELNHEKDYARDCVDCPEKNVKLDRITVRLRFTGNLDDDQRRRLREIAGRCPVHRTLTGQIEIVDVDAG
ncbi:MAG TPA: OsmC family protein [Armatimonadota bacterium]|nr:OsmC family protein [Armatimonadota bacterium]